MNNELDILAPCGVYCGACPSYGRSCKGCASEDKNQSRRSKWGCKIRICCYEKKELRYCINCEEYPCKIIHNKLLSTHRNDPRFNYRHELPEIFKKMKTMGVEGFLNFQKDKWKCDSCDGTVQFYVYKCNCCGKEQPKNQHS